MGIRSLGNPTESYNAVWSSSGKGAVLPPPSAIVATGGPKTESGLYTIHSFTGPGTFVVSAAPGSANIQYLVVGGGGGGSQGGGGAGGMRTNVTGQTPGGPG